MLNIVPVTLENRAQILALSVAQGQEHFVETTRECLEEASRQFRWRPVGLYAGDTPVGFAMYGEFPERDELHVWLDRLLIDARYQGRGFGEEALELLLKRLVEEYGCHRIFLSVYDDNPVAYHLYEKHGFHPNGERDINGEVILVHDEEA